MSKKLIIIVLMLVIVLAGILFFTNKGREPLEEFDIHSELEETANELFLKPSFFTLAGKEITIAKYLTGPEEFFLIDVWATWCGPCKVALLDYQKNLNYFKQNNIKLIAISIGEPRNTVSNFVEKNSLSFEVLLDNNEITLRDWGVKSIPHIFLLNKKGELILSKIGYDNFSSFSAEINKAMAKDLAR